MQVPCPSCSKPALLLQNSENVEHFGEVLISTLSCSLCGLKLNDVWNTKFDEPLAFKAKAASISDLKIKIVRSTSGTVEIPELGTTIEPGPLADGYISNLEGLLDRVQAIIQLAERSHHDAKSRANASKLLQKLALMREGKLSFHVLVKDPFGNSALIGNKVQKIPLSAKEAGKLKHYFLFAGR